MYYCERKNPKCTNPECDRLVDFLLQYCCAKCERAYLEGYEIHESGILGHSDACNTQHTSRKTERR